MLGSKFKPCYVMRQQPLARACACPWCQTSTSGDLTQDGAESCADVVRFTTWPDSLRAHVRLQQ